MNTALPLRTKDGSHVEDRTHSHAKIPLSLLARVLALVVAGGRSFFKTTVDLGEIVGEGNCLPTTAKDIPRIVFARRVGRKGLTRFVESNEPCPTSLVTVVLKAMQEKEGYVLIAAWIGADAEVEPWDARATEDARRFWKSHALRWGSEEVEPSTRTRVHPPAFV